MLSDDSSVGSLFACFSDHPVNAIINICSYRGKAMKRSVLVLMLLVGCVNARSGLWPDGSIPFIAIGLSGSELSAVTECMIKWELATKGAIRFRPVVDIEDEYLFITHQDIPNATEAYVQMGTRRTLYITSDSDNRAILHGLGHVIGLYHEHQRIDRDSYISVEIYPGNPPMVDMQLSIYAPEDSACDQRQYPYDYRSIMHYREKDVEGFGRINGHGNELGNDEISFLDALKVINMYSVKDNSELGQ